MTNADIVRKMSDEELAKILEPLCMFASELFGEIGSGECPTLDKPCVECWRDWLKQEVTDNG